MRKCHVHPVYGARIRTHDPGRFCLRPKAKDLGITRVVVNLVVVLGFFICSMPYRHLPFPIYQYIIAADPGAGLSLVIIEI